MFQAVEKKEDRHFRFHILQNAHIKLFRHLYGGDLTDSQFLALYSKMNLVDAYEKLSLHGLIYDQQVLKEAEEYNEILKECSIYSSSLSNESKSKKAKAGAAALIKSLNELGAGGVHILIYQEADANAKKPEPFMYGTGVFDSLLFDNELCDIVEGAISGKRILSQACQTTKIENNIYENPREI